MSEGSYIFSEGSIDTHRNNDIQNNKETEFSSRTIKIEDIKD